MAQAAPPGRPFRVAAVNVNGLNAVPRRREVFTWLQNERVDVALLSETHCTDTAMADGWVRDGAGPGRPWQGMGFWCNQHQQGGRAAGGVGVLLSQRIVGQAADPVIEHQSPEGVLANTMG
jgi:exonuclease III